MVHPSSMPSNRFQLLCSPLRLPVQFSCLFPSSAAPPSLLFSPPAGTIPRERKRRSALSQHRFTFLSHSVCGLSGSRTECCRADKNAEIPSTCNHIYLFWVFTGRDIFFLNLQPLKQNFEPLWILPLVLFQLVFHVCRQTATLWTGQILKRWR